MGCMGMCACALKGASPPSWWWGCQLRELGPSRLAPPQPFISCILYFLYPFCPAFPQAYCAHTPLRWCLHDTALLTELNPADHNP
jgi:hypothetical protein